MARVGHLADFGRPGSPNLRQPASHPRPRRPAPAPAPRAALPSPCAAPASHRAAAARRRPSPRRAPRAACRRAPPHRYLRLPQPTSRGQRPLPDLRLKPAVSFCLLASNRRSHDDRKSGRCGRQMRCRPVPTPALFTVNQRRRHRLFCLNLYELRPISICFASAYIKYERIGC